MAEEVHSFIAEDTCVFSFLLTEERISAWIVKLLEHSIGRKRRFRYLVRIQREPSWIGKVPVDESRGFFERRT